MIPDCTLVTAVYDLSNYNNKYMCRDTFISKMDTLLQTPCYLVIYTDTNCIDIIQEKRSHYKLNHLTKYVVKEFTELPKYVYLDTVIKNRDIYFPSQDKRTGPESHLICCSKIDFILDTLHEKYFNTSKVAWIDANCGKNFEKICNSYKNNTLLQILSMKTEKFHIQIMNACEKKYILDENLKEYYSKYRYIVCGSFFLTGNEIGKKIMNELNRVFEKTTQLGYGHSEEMFYLEILETCKDDIVRTYGDYEDILNNFIIVKNNIHYLCYNVIANYYTCGEYRECYDCCEKIKYHYDHFEIEINYSIYVDILFFKLACTYHFDKLQNAIEKKRFISLIQTNPYIEKEYNEGSSISKNNEKFIFHNIQGGVNLFSNQ